MSNRQYTVRGIPEAVHRELSRRARKTRKSLNRTVIELLVTAAGGTEKRSDFGWLAGTWAEDPGFEAIVADQQMIDEKLWR